MRRSARLVRHGLIAHPTAQPYHPRMMMVWLAQHFAGGSLTSPWYPWIGPGLIAIVLGVGVAWLLVKRWRRRVWDALAAELNLSDESPRTFEELVELRQRLSRHVLVLIAGIEGVERRLVGTLDDAQVEVLDFEAFGVGHWAPMSVRLALRDPDEALTRVDFTRDRPGFGELMQTAVRLTAPDLNLPRFILMPENYMTRRVPEPRGIELPDAYPLFSYRNRLLAADAHAVARVTRLFDRPVQLALERNGDLTIEGDGDTLMIYRVGHAMTPASVKQLLVDVMELRQMFAQRGGTG
jgi:hypothetical protein